jgi:Histidine kinase
VKRVSADRPPVVDVVVAAGAAVVVIVGSVLAAGVQTPPRPLDAWAYLLMVVAAGALAWRRAAPMVALVGAVGAVGVYLLGGYAYGPIQLCMVVAMFEVARRVPPRTSLLACGLAAGAAVGFVLARLARDADLPAVLVSAWTGWLVVPWSLGALVQVRSAAAERMRRDLMARAALEERMRVAREVHDVAGHGLAVVAMQAGVGLLVLEERPDQARESLEAIRATSAKALTELRATLDAVHPPAAAGPAAAPTPAAAPAAATMPATFSFPAPDSAGRRVGRSCIGCAPCPCSTCGHRARRPRSCRPSWRGSRTTRIRVRRLRAPAAASGGATLWAPREAARTGVCYVADPPPRNTSRVVAASTRSLLVHALSC